MELGQVQRTKEWYLCRKGKMTASEIYLLLNNHKVDVPLTAEEQEQFRQEHPRAKMPETKKIDAPFSDGTFTYLNKKIAEYFMSDDAFLEDTDLKQLNNKAVQFGTFWEDEARERYALEMGYEIMQVGFIPLKGFEVYAGGSPDGIICNENGIIEIKCPFGCDVHQDYLLFEKPEDLKEYNLQYYVQCQMNMIVTETDFCDFISFDPRTAPGKQLKVLRIPRDQEMCNLLIERIKCAKDYYIERMDRLEKARIIIK